MVAFILSVSREGWSMTGSLPVKIPFLKPKPKPEPKPEPKPQPEPEPEPDIEDEYSNFEVYFGIGRQVDSYRSNSQLQKNRSPASHSTDSCVIAEEHESFAESIGWGVEQAFILRDQELEYVSYRDWDPFNIYTTAKEPMSH